MAGHLDEPATANLVVLCSLQTLRRRSLFPATDAEAAKVVKTNDQIAETASMEGPADNPDDDDVVERAQEAKGGGMADNKDEVEETESQLSHF